MGCCRSRTTQVRTPFVVDNDMTTRKLPQNRYSKPYKITPVNDTDDTFMIFIKGQFGRTIEVHGLTETTKIRDVKKNIERNYGIPPSKLRYGGLMLDYNAPRPRENTKEEEIGFKNGTLSFPTDLTLKELNIKANDVIFWSTFHDKYLKQITVNKIVDNDINSDIDTNKDAVDNVNNTNIDQSDDNGQYTHETVIKLDNLLNDDIDTNETLKTLRICLEKRGFCLIEYPSNIQNKIDLVSENILKAINGIDLDQFEEEKEWKSILNEFGYFYHENYKQSLRILTGKSLKKYKNDYPSSIRNDIVDISGIMDDLCNKIIAIGYKSEYLWKNIDSKIINSEITLTNKDKKCGMIDFVKYLNINNPENSEYRMISKNKMNVSCHTDPGLFSLSFISTNDGLQMFDITTKNWIKIPLKYGVIFAGETMPYISDGRLKSGIHRVTFNDNNKFRFTGWYEVCAYHQINRGSFFG